MTITIWGYDIGETTKVVKFVADVPNKTVFFAPDSLDEQGQPFVRKVTTPHGVPASSFMEELTSCLAEASLQGTVQDMRGYSVCGPVVQGRCLRLINRDVLEPFAITAGHALNDGMAATIGSMMAGVATEHDGSIAFLTLGSGIGFGAFHWDEHGKLVPNNGEIHFTVRGANRKCNCHRVGCFEAAANESALLGYCKRELAQTDCQQFSLDDDGLGMTIEKALTDTTHELYPHDQELKRALATWCKFLARGIANIFVLLNLGGNDWQPPPMFVLGGGLSSLVDPARLRKTILAEFDDDPLVGKQFVISKEDVIGNLAGCIGAACMEFASRLEIDVTEIKFAPLST